MTKRFALSALAAGLAFTLAAGSAAGHENHAAKTSVDAAKKEQKPWGIAGEARDARRTIEVAMSDDMRFAPSHILVRQGETVKFVVRNRGKVLHEMVIGDRATLDEHAALMVKFPAMEHDEPYMAHVAAGKEGVLVWTFNRAGDFDFACLIPGHYQAGMVGRIKVVAAAGPAADAATVSPAAQPPEAPAAAATPAAAAEMAEGEVRRVDRGAGKITLRHGEIRSLDMPPMTMVFAVTDPAMLDRVKPGDTVRFRAVRQEGRYTVTEIEAAP